MKRKILLSILMATSMFAKTELSLSIGTNSFDNDEALDTATTLGVRGDFYLDDLYHLDLGYDNLGDVTFENTNNSIKIERFYTQFSADGAEEYHVVPTLSIGAGYEKQKGDYADSEPFISLGIGFRYNVSNSFNFLLGTKALWKTSSRDINYHTTFGIGYLIDEEPANNEQKDVEEVIIPKKKLSIPELHSPAPVVVKKEPVVIDTKEAAVEPVSTSQTLPPPPAMEVPAISTVKVASAAPRSIKATGYFIQVAAYTKYRPTSMLDRLAQNGNRIILRHQGRVTKALVGPFASEEEAQRALYKVKKIAKGAFIYKGN